MTTQRATCWSVTINNPNKADEENIQRARQQSGWRVYGQLEKGESGTPHYQLMVTTPQVRFAAVKKLFPRAHIEIARDRKALEKYVSKEDTRIGSLSISQDKYPTHSKLMEWYGEFFTQYGIDHDGVDNNEYLKIFDLMCDRKIREGYYVETLAVNPQIRCAIQKFGRAINFRESARRQTDRQTPEINVDLNNINAYEESLSSSSSSVSSSSSSQGREESD